MVIVIAPKWPAGFNTDSFNRKSVSKGDDGKERGEEWAVDQECMKDHRCCANINRGKSYISQNISVNEGIGDLETNYCQNSKIEKTKLFRRDRSPRIPAWAKLVRGHPLILPYLAEVVEPRTSSRAKRANNSSEYHFWD